MTDKVSVSPPTVFGWVLPTCLTPEFLWVDFLSDKIGWPEHTTTLVEFIELTNNDQSYGRADYLLTKDKMTMIVKFQLLSDNVRTEIFRDLKNIPLLWISTHQNCHIKWWQHVTNDNLYGSLKRVGDRIVSWRMALAGLCYRHKKLSANKVILWDPVYCVYGHRNRRKPTKIYLDTLMVDAWSAGYRQAENLYGGLGWVEDRD